MKLGLFFIACFLIILSCSSGISKKLRPVQFEIDQFDSLASRIILENNGADWYLKNRYDFRIAVWFRDTTGLFDVAEVEDYANLEPVELNSLVNMLWKDERFQMLLEERRKIVMDAYKRGNAYFIQNIGICRLD